MTDEPKIKLVQTYGDHGIRFAGPDLLDYIMIFEISDGDFDGERISIDSSYHLCCGTLEIRAGLFKIYKNWTNSLDGCKQHRREGEGDRRLRDIVWSLSMISE